MRREGLLLSISPLRGLSSCKVLPSSHLFNSSWPPPSSNPPDERQEIRPISFLALYYHLLLSFLAWMFHFSSPYMGLVNGRTLIYVSLFSGAFLPLFTVLIPANLSIFSM